MTGQADKATADINRIRLRSNLVPLAGTATMKDLYHERRCELAFEFTDHLFDSLEPFFQCRHKDIGR